ncbi:MAG TPA: transporter [Saprospiraceae bacterium]|nr:transporter [Saprospiraceae bacterium]
MSIQLLLSKQLFVILAVILISVSSIVAQERPDLADTTWMVPDAIETDRPDQTETASLVPKGYFQMENGFSIEDTEPGFLYTHPSTLWKIGVSDFFEVRVITEYINIQLYDNPKVDGLLPVQVGFKSKLLNQRGIIPKTSFIGHISLPGLASKQFQQTYFAPNFRLAFLHHIRQRFSVSYNLGAEWDGETPRPDFLYSLSLGANIIGGLGIYGELYGSMPQQREEDNELRADAGFTYLITNDVIADISGGIGISDNAPEKYIAIGFSYRFKM